MAVTVPGDRIENIAMLALKELDHPEGKVLVYAEIEEGVESCDLIAETGPGSAFLRYASAGLRERVYRIWEEGSPDPAARWRILALEIDGDRFRARLTYPDDVDDLGDPGERRMAAIRILMGEVSVDYSRRHGR